MRRRYGSIYLPLRFLCGWAILLASLAASASEHHGQVFYHGYPVPGATVTVSQGAKHLSTVTDEQGLYEFTDLADGKWEVEIDMRGFSPLRGEIVVAPNAQQGAWELKLLDLAQMLAQMKATKPQFQPQLAIRSEGTQPPGSAATAAPTPSPEAVAEKAVDGLLINGSTNNAATSQYSLASAFGNRRPGARSLYTGGLGAVINNSVFDARPYSLSGLQVPKDEYSRVTMLASLGGPLKIPHLFYHGPTFFLAYQWTRDRDAANESGLVPDAAERSGDLSGLLNPLGQPVMIYNPVTGQPVTGVIPVSPQAQALLNLYPLPNLAGSARYNYQTEVLNNTHVDSLQSRLDKSIGRLDEVYGGFGFRSARADNANLFNFRDATDTLGIETNVNWAHQYRHHIYAVLGYHFTRLRTEITPEFANRENISGLAGIEGNNQSPENWGPPSLAFASGIAALSDANSEFNRNRTDAFSLKLSTTHRRHTIMFGGDFRKQEFNEFAQQNPRGTFTFTGAATQAPGSSGTTATTTGSDLADFLFGIPDASAVAYGNPDKYFRQPVYDAYVSDDFRASPELTINAGMRWEYGAPMSELYGRLVNLDIAPGFAAALPVLASDPTGPVTGTRYPSSLIRPDRRGFEPRVGISWRPIPASTLLVKAGYGIYDDTSIYLSSAELMAQQAPLSTSVAVANSATCPLTLARGFRNCPGITDDPYAVDPNLRVGYAQVWQASVQRDLPAAIVMTATYLGTKGTRGLQEFLPNTYPIGAVSPCSSCPVGFVYRSSNGNSTRQAGELQLRRRLRSGFTASVDYTWAKALDDDSQIGAQGHVETQAATALPGENTTPTPTPSVAQDWRNLAAERGLSTFDQRNLVKGSLQYTTGMGLGGDTLMSGRMGRYLKEWTVMTQFNADSGLPENPVYLATVPGTGVTGSIRPDRTQAPIYTGPPGYFLNSAAYTAPAPGQWGTARRNSITGPNEFSLDSSLARTFRIRAAWNLDVRMDATNVLNHAAFTAWNTTVNSSIFGLPAGANQMRSLQLTGRLRF